MRAVERGAVQGKGGRRQESAGGSTADAREGAVEGLAVGAIDGAVSHIGDVPIELRSAAFGDETWFCFQVARMAVETGVSGGREEADADAGRAEGRRGAGDVLRGVAAILDDVAVTGGA